MQTQRIMPSVTDGTYLAGNKMSGVEKASESDTFGQIMENHTKTSESKQDVTETEKTETHLSKETKDVNFVKVSETAKPEAEESKILDLSEAEEETLALLQETFGLSKEDLLDIMEQMGITPVDLLCGLDSMTGQYQLLDMDQIKAVVMEVYGVQDESIFLINDTLSTKLDELTTGLKQILSDTLQIQKKDMAALLESGVFEPVEQPAEQSEALLENETVMSVKQETVEVKEGEAVLEMNFTKGEGEDAEMNFSSNPNQTGDFSEKTTVVQRDVKDAEQVDTRQLTENFVNQLEKAFGEVKTDAVQTTDSMRSIVEQIVNHVKVRVLPQSTSMELMLNPASLGRVLLNVTTTKGVLTATMTVQNEVVKEAIENQMITLQQTFEEKGIKVSAIEVNVSEFGFQKDGENEKRDFSGHPGGKSKGRRFRMIAEDAVANQEEVEIGQDSLINYTA